MIRFACSVALLAGLAASARADLAPPPPAKGFKRVPYEIVMKLEKEVPGYKFYTFSRMGLGGQETVGGELKLGTEKAVAVPSSSSPSVRTGVVAVPVRVMDQLRTTETLAKLLSREAKDELPAGVVIYETRGTSSDLKESDPRTKVENVVTVSPDDGAGVKFTAQETPAPDHDGGNGGDPTEVGRSQLVPVIVGVALAAALVALGVWYSRRR